MTAIAVAAGGGGDAVTAALLGSALPGEVAAIMSYSWDRLMVDPTPGPRSRSDFAGLVDRGGVWQVSPSSGLRIGLSTLPRLAGHLDVPLLLMDLDGGVRDLARQIRRTATVFGVEEVLVIDVGGDIVAVGHEPELRSPLADSAALAAAVSTGMPARVLVAGAGLDGELAREQVEDRLTVLGAEHVVDLTASHARRLIPVWSWHPSEANALLAAAAIGWRGLVETQRGAVIDVTDLSTRVVQVPATSASEASLASLLTETSSLGEIETILRVRRGYSDIDIEREKAERRLVSRMPAQDVLNYIDRHAVSAVARGVDALTIRRIAELVGATDPLATEALRDYLSRHRPRNFAPPLYLTVPSAPIR
ncbi:DUF1152 domain-containing protein [Nocardia sp. N2S4-5]|uniref:DUF1152 domain-containing protein n=1 Tax=Nocardia sp. N2S4-5 TaxID=3351565 RepID=UPI0037D20F36